MAEAVSVNPNVEVSGKGEPISVTGDMSMVSFDDLENADVGDPGEQSNDQSVQGFSEKGQSVPDTEGTEKEAGADEIDDEARDPANSKSAEPTGTQQDQVDEPEGEKDEPDEETLSGEHGLSQDKQVAVFAKAKLGDQEYEVPVDAVIPTKVAGKTETPTLSELQKEYSGTVNLDREYQKLAEEKKSIAADKELTSTQATNLATVVNEFLEASQEAPTKMFDVIATLTQQDAVELKMQFWDSLKEQALQLSQMDDTELALARKQAEVNFREESVNARAKRMEQATKRDSDQTKTQGVLDKYGMSSGEYQECFKEAGKLLNGQREADSVDAVYVFKHRQVTDAVRTSFPEFSTDSRYAKVLNKLVAEAVEDPTFTTDEVVDTLAKVLGTNQSSDGGSQERAARLSKKARHTASVTNSANKKASRKVPVTFDDLDEDVDW